MSNPHLPESPAASPIRPGGRHQIKRSLTEFALPAKPHWPRHHRGDRQRDDKATQSYASAMQTRLPTNMPRSEDVTPILSPIQSRRASVLKGADDKPDLRDGKEEKLPGEQEKASLSTDGWKQSLQEINVSADTTRRLDGTYYAILEKMSALQTTVMALKDLAETSRYIQVRFERMAQELETDIMKQLRAIGEFESQQDRIEALQSRIHKERENMVALATRVDVVRELVEGWERADKVWQERTRKRLAITWTALSLLVLLAVILLMLLDYSPEDVEAQELGAQRVWRSTTVELEPFSNAKQPISWAEMAAKTAQG